jgi:DNA-binding transcriptional regulator YiaG
MKKSILETAHTAAKGLFDIGLIDAKTMRSFDIMCLP